LTDEGLAADLRIGDFTQLPWPDESFDGAVENVSLCANPWTGIQRALGELRRVLKPGAPFLSSFFSDQTWGYGQGEMVETDGFVNLPEGRLQAQGSAFFSNEPECQTSSAISPMSMSNESSGPWTGSGIWWNNL
jgi:ubiquinone/menaquinone biosynthesis C-methylase UbiE